MRSLKKFFIKLILVIKNYKYIKENINYVKNKLNAQSIIFASFGGADINFLIKKDKKIIAMMRLAIIDEKMNRFVIDRFDKKRRLSNEINAYKKCSIDNLTPELLISNENFTVCKYIDGFNANTILKQGKIDIYEFYESILKIYMKIHEKEVSHLDATLKNIFYDNSSKSFKVVDFEYYAQKDLSFEKQKLYDYLRISEYILRTYKKDIPRFINILDETILNNYNDIDLTIVRPLLKSLDKIDEMKNYLNNKNIKI